MCLTRKHSCSMLVLQFMIFLVKWLQKEHISLVIWYANVGTDLEAEWQH